MKSNYTRPVISVINLAEEDVIRTSTPAEKLMQGEYGAEDLFS